MSEYHKITTHRLVVGATPDVMQAAREAASAVARDSYADAILKGRCDGDELVLACATAILSERNKWAIEIEHKIASAHNAALRKVWEESRRYAYLYPVGSDGRNTFGCFCDFVRNLYVRDLYATVQTKTNRGGTA